MKNKKPKKRYFVEICATAWITRRVDARTEKEAEKIAISRIGHKRLISRARISTNAIELVD